MLSTATTYEHIQLDESNQPVIAGANMKIVELVLSHRAYGWSPEELNFQYPHLSMGQIYSALAYYWDHREKLDRDIDARLQRVKQAQASSPASPLQHRLRNQSLAP